MTDTMNEADVVRLESELGISLPESFRHFLMGNRSSDYIDDVTVMDDADSIIEATRLYRNGFSGLKPWPNRLVYVGDEADACPYVIDCEDGKFSQIHKGNIEERPLKEFASFDEFLTFREKEAQVVVSESEQRLRGFLFFLPLIKAMLFIFVVIPGFAVAIKLFFEWLSE